MHHFVILMCILKCIASKVTTDAHTTNVLDEKVNLSIYYESHCLHSRYFYRKEFFSIVEELGDHLNVYINPYGKANTTINSEGDISFRCQRGPDECYCGQMHACLIKTMSIKHANRIVDCLFNYFYFRCSRNSLLNCSIALNFDLNPILSCAGNSDGRQYFKEFGDENLKDLKYLPTVTVNGDVFVNPENLRELICNAFESKPVKCGKSPNAI